VLEGRFMGVEEEGKVGDQALEVVVGISTAIFMGDIVVGRTVETPTVRNARLLDSSAEETVPAIVSQLAIPFPERLSSPPINPLPQQTSIRIAKTISLEYLVTLALDPTNQMRYKFGEDSNFQVSQSEPLAIATGIAAHPNYLAEQSSTPRTLFPLPLSKK